MSKSYGNVINIEISSEDLKDKILTMITDPARKRKTDPGNPEICPAWDYHKAFGASKEEKEYIMEGCLKAKIGCIECKKILLKNMEATLSPIRDKLIHVDSHKGLIDEIIASGNKNANRIASETMKEVRKAMNLLF